MPTPIPTVNELVATIRRSTLPTVVVEGAEDVLIYRWMEGLLRASNVSFLPCNSRATVLSLFERRLEFSSKQVVFLADQDMWVFGGTPEEYGDVIFTAGYSIENDVLASGSADRLFEVEEKAALRSILAMLEEWFAFEALQHSLGNVFIVNVPIRKIIDFDKYTLNPVHCSSRGFARVTGPLREVISSDPLRYIRGKTLLDAYAFLLNSDGRASRFSKKSILEMCVKMPLLDGNCGPIVNEICRRMGLK